MGTDRYAYQSRLRRISPMPKLLLTGSALVLCLLCDSGFGLCLDRKSVV